MLLYVMLICDSDKTINDIASSSYFLPSTLEKGWNPPKDVSPPSLKKPPPTGEWTLDTLKFFKLHYYQVSDWAQYICDTTSEMPQTAKDLADLDLNIEEIIQSMSIICISYTNIYTPLQYFLLFI